MISGGCDNDTCADCPMMAFDYTEYTGGQYYCDDTFYYLDENLDGTPEGWAELPSPSCYWDSCDDDSYGNYGCVG